MYTNKTYIAFNADPETGDRKYYHLMEAWKENDSHTFNFHNAHEINNMRDDSQEITVKRKLRERFADSNKFILLVGSKTKYQYKYVRWEIEVAITIKIPIIVVNLNNKKRHDPSLCPAILADVAAIHIPFEQKIIKKAIDKWNRKPEVKTNPYHYNDEGYC